MGRFERSGSETLSGPVQHRMGFAIYQARIGLRHRDAKPLEEFGSGVLEAVSRHGRDVDIVIRQPRSDSGGKLRIAAAEAG